MVQVLFYDGDSIFQDDNAPTHTAHLVKNLNVIEHALAVRLGATSWNLLPSAVVSEWAWTGINERMLKIPSDEVRKLYDSIPRRIKAVEKAGRAQTLY